MNIVKKNKSPKTVLKVIVVYALCFLFRYVEYFFLRTDSTIIGEAILHKLIGIVIMVLGAKFFLQDISLLGFADKAAIKKTLWGIGLGVGAFTLAYFVEVLILFAQGNFNSLALYVTTYSVDKNIGNQTATLFFVICIIGNIVNVIMEEGIFRGLFQKILEKRYCFFSAALLSSILFGLWHLIAPVRSYIDGSMSIGATTANIIMLVFTSGIIGFKFALITKLTKSLYMSMGDHFVNNTIVNILHIVSNTGSDELMFVRIAIAQTVSFLIVMVYYLKHQGTKAICNK